MAEKGENIIDMKKTSEESQKKRPKSQNEK